MLLAAAALALAPATAATVRPQPVEGLPFFSGEREQASASASSGRTDVRASSGARALQLPDDAIAYIPASAGPHPPLLVLLHGADHRPAWMIEKLAKQADARGLALLAPTSRAVTWDAVSDAEGLHSMNSPLAVHAAHRYGGSRDGRRVEAAIAALKAQVPIDHARIALAGFSDGATFALAMGMQRSGPFAAVIAWSPGIALETVDPARGRRVFVSHGRQDPVLSYRRVHDDIVPELCSEGAQVTFLPFDGVHEIPQVAQDAFLDAVFGPMAGAPLHPLPARTAVCAERGGTKVYPTFSLPTAASSVLRSLPCCLIRSST
jgi:phospholipase/carboxylesterase